jgi:hypothetical protein
MSRVYTDKQLAQSHQIIKGYEMAVLERFRKYRIAEADLGGAVIQRIFDAIATGDSAYRLEEAEMWRTWIDQYLGTVGAGRLGREQTAADKAWMRSWKLHQLPNDFLQEDPSPLVLVDQTIAIGGFPALPQEPQKRLRITLTDGSHRSIRIKD